MESFFVPVYLKFGKLSEEKLLVALIGVSESNIWFNFSAKRIEFSSKIAGQVFGHLAQKVLEQIQFKTEEINKGLGKQSNSLFNVNHVFNVDYFGYLQKYSQNTVVFGPVEFFNFTTSPIGFKELYESFMNEGYIENKEVKQSFQTKIRHKLEAANIQDKADIDFKITPEQINGLYNNTIVSLISKNGGLLAANAIDFSNSIQTLAQSLNSFEILIISLNKFAEKYHFEKSQYSIVTSMPAIGSEQEKLMNNIYKNKKEVFDIVPEDSIGIITEKLRSSHYHKFSTVLLENHDA
jgi:hypothetical protein